MLGYFDHPTGQAGDSSEASDDADGDGLSNLQEFQAGTNPLDATSALAITSIAAIGDDIQVNWQSAPGKTNQLQRSSTPDSSGAWNTMLTTTGTTATATGAATNSLWQFYRVLLVP